jgi:capsid protein
VDPLKDKQADEIDVAHGWTTNSAVTAARGGDWFANIDRLEQERKHANDRGVPIDGNASATQRAQAMSDAESAGESASRGRLQAV